MTNARIKEIQTWPLKDAPLQRWILLVLFSALLALLLFPSILAPTPKYDLGDVVSKDIKAGQTFFGGGPRFHGGTPQGV